MYPNCLLRNILWCLPCRLPYGNGHYATGPELVILSNMISIEQCLTNFSCNLLGYAPKAPCALKSHRKEKTLEMSQGYNNWGCNNNCCHQEEKKEYFPKCECCCCKYHEKKEEPKKEECKEKCATIKVCIEEPKHEEKKDDKKDDCCY